MPEVTRTSIIENVVCQGCSCACDDLQVTVADNRVVELNADCSLAESWFGSFDEQPAEAAYIAGQPASVSDAMQRAGEILRAARSPLIYGLAGSSTASVRAAIELAERSRAVIDIASSCSIEPSLLALQEVGKSTCTLGEVRHYADLVIYWGADPLQSHPRHWDRYAVSPRGDHVPEGRADRRVVVINSEPNRTSAEADLFVQIDPDQQFEALWQLMAIVSPTEAVDEQAVSEVDPALVQLATWMRECQVGVVFHGSQLGSQPLGHRHVETLHRLVVKLNDVARFYVMGLGSHGEAAGADSVLAWSTGYPLAVDFAHGFPRYAPGENAVSVLLERGEVDVCLLVGKSPTSQLTPAAIERLRTLPTIWIGPASESPEETVAVRVIAKKSGVHLAGSAHRMDDVSIPARAFLSSQLASEQQLLNQLLGLSRNG